MAEAGFQTSHHYSRSLIILGPERVLWSEATQGRKLGFNKATGTWKFHRSQAIGWLETIFCEFKNCDRSLGIGRHAR